MKSLLPLVVWGLLAGLPVVAHALGSFVTFESGQVRPLALSPDGTRLFAVNTPDARLEIFAIDARGLRHLESVAVGLEPVSVAARSDAEVWVVNHLSDSVSVLEVGSSPARVTRTLLVGDEPRDLVFAGPRESGEATGPFTRAFITTAHRGQNHPVDPQLTTAGVGRADVWVFDTGALGNGLGGTPLAIVNLFGDTPRALAASPDGSQVYAAVFHSGNQTTIIPERAVPNSDDPCMAEPPCRVPDEVALPGGLTDGEVPPGLPPPRENVDGVPGPEVGLIVRFDPETGAWRDELRRNWTNAVRFDLPDLDVFRIDAAASPPVEVGAWAGVGTLLFNMAVNPASGRVYVSNTEARNEVRFEGAGRLSTTVRGHLHEARISVLAEGSVAPRHLNPHIPYAAVPMPAGVKERSLATPLGMAVSSDGRTLYLAAFGSDKVAVLGTEALEAGSFVPRSSDHIPLSGGGPTGLVLDEARGQLYVLTRFDNAISVVDLTSRRETAHQLLHNPEPPRVVEGRRLLYDAAFSSSNGEASCAACHAFADFDSLAWDLGDPEGRVTANPNPTTATGFRQPFHPLKGPMTTQTLRGLAHHGPMHWRGDRTGGNASPPLDPLDEVAAFESFNGAFEALLGRDEGPIPDDAMRAFADFVLEITPPPNPIRALDNSLDPLSEVGRRRFFVDDGLLSCTTCHALEPEKGFFGTRGNTAFAGFSQEFKAPQLRNLYQRVGMFGVAAVPSRTPVVRSTPHMGPQIRGYGFLNDGGLDRILRLFLLPEIETWVMQFPSTLAPIVGQQVTLTGANSAATGPRLDLMISRARTLSVLVDHPEATECDLIAKGVDTSGERGWLLDPMSGLFQPDTATQPPVPDAQLRARAMLPGAALTYTCTPPGSGVRMGIDRDQDFVLDADDNCPSAANSDQQDRDGDGTGDRCEGEPSRGDLDGDGDVDRDDLRRLLAERGRSVAASACGSVCDLDEDGRITALDARKLVLACSRPACASP